MLTSTRTLLKVDRREDCAFHEYYVLHIAVMPLDYRRFIHLALDITLCLGQLSSNNSYVFDFADYLFRVGLRFASEKSGGFRS
jgi:hypothetical protein